jgi:glycosyltransferase involved in cell wall biosynthesis
MMKKKLLFVMPDLNAGGGEKSLVNLLFQIDYERYHVDLFLFSKTGTFLQSLPEEVNVLDIPTNHLLFTSQLKNSIWSFIRHGKWNLAYSRLMFSTQLRLIPNKAISEQHTWKYISKSFDTLAGEYDTAIGYLEKSSIYFAVDKVKAKKKIGWIHTNYADSGMKVQYDDPYFKQLNHLVTVSEECARSLKEHFIDLNQRIKVIYNIVSPQIINRMSNLHMEESALFNNDYTNVITIARLSHEKGIDMAIQSCSLLVKKGYKVKWYVLGEGNERDNLEKLIKDNQLQQHFKLLGVKENPYPYIKQADIYVQPSRYEGKSIAIDEAKILHKPIVVTNFETAKDQINDGTNGLIVGFKAEEIASGIEKLMKNMALTNKMVRNLSNEKLGTEEEIGKLYEIL